MAVFDIGRLAKGGKKKKKWNFLLLPLLALGVGFFSSFLVKDQIAAFAPLQAQIPLSPPSALFPVVWTILYILMGISLALVLYQQPYSSNAITIWVAQLAVNFFWSLLFFGKQWYLASFLWLILLWWLIVTMISVFYTFSPLAAKLQIPYLLWVTFAGYLNFATFLLSRA